MTGNGPYIALACVVGIPTGLLFGALIPTLAFAVLTTNLALHIAFRLWGDWSDA